MKKFEARQIARQFAVKALRAMDMPNWPIDMGLIEAADTRSHGWFMEEIRSIANRIDNQRKAERNQRNKGPGQRHPNRRERRAALSSQEPA